MSAYEVVRDGQVVHPQESIEAEFEADFSELESPEIGVGAKRKRGRPPKRLSNDRKHDLDDLSDFQVVVTETTTDEKTGLKTEVEEVVYLPIDTTDDFADVFSEKDKFESWEQFITLFEEFQRRSLTVFKPRQAMCVTYANEKRIREKIPEEIVYTAVKMICKNYGTPKIAEGSTRKKDSYIGKDCGAFVRLSYKQGYLHITDMCLIHNNHPPESAHTKMDSVIRKVRPVAFTDDLDLRMVQCLNSKKVYEYKNPVLLWQEALVQLQRDDVRMRYLSLRMLRKRIQFLMERYNFQSTNEELDASLQEMIDSKRKTELVGYIPKKRGRKKLAEKRAEIRRMKEENLDDDYGDEDSSFMDTPSARSNQYTPAADSPKPVSFGGDKNLTSLLNYWKSRDAEDRKLRLKEMGLRKEEMEVRRREMELLTEKFELEKNERKMLLDVVEMLKDQQNKVVTMEIHTQDQPEMESQEMVEHVEQHL